MRFDTVNCRTVSDELAAPVTIGTITAPANPPSMVLRFNSIMRKSHMYRSHLGLHRGMYKGEICRGTAIFRERKIRKYDLPLIARHLFVLRGKMTCKGFSRLSVGFLGCESGAVAVEYVVIAAAMFLALIPSFLYVASGMLVKFSSVGGYFEGL